MTRCAHLLLIPTVFVVGGILANPAAAACWVCRGSGCWPAGDQEYGRKLCFRPYGFCQLAGTLCEKGGNDDGGIDEQDWLKPNAQGLLPVSGCAAPVRSVPFHHVPMAIPADPSTDAGDAPGWAAVPSQ